MVANLSDGWAQCFTVGTASTSTSTTTGNWMTGGNWSSGSPGCSINSENDEIEVNVDMNLPSASCGGGDLSMVAKTNLQVVSNSTLTIDGDMNLDGELICIYVESGSTLKILGNFNFNKDKITLIIDGTLEVTGAFDCNGDCTGGGAAFPAFGGSGTYTAGGGCTGFGGGQAQCGVALPIELLDFSATAKKGFVQLDWSTASELNNDFFTVEKLFDIETTKTVSTVKGSGTSYQQLEYSAIDPYPNSGLNYYRLKQTDFDGQFSYSNIAAVIYELLIPQVTISPNPIISGSEVSIRINEPESINLSFHDLTGKLMFKKFYTNARELIVLNNDLQSFPSGIYLVTVKGNGYSVTKRLIVYP